MNFNQLCPRHAARPFITSTYIQQGILFRKATFFLNKNNIFYNKMFRNVKKSLAAPRTSTDNAIKRYIYGH